MSMWAKLRGLLSRGSDQSSSEAQQDYVLMPMPGAPPEQVPALEKLALLAPVPGVAPLTPPIPLPREIKAAPEHAPDPIADLAVEFTAERAFDLDPIRSSLSKELRESFGNPWLHTRQADGRVIFFGSGKEAQEGVSIFAAWSLADGEPAEIKAFADAFARWIAGRPEGLKLPQIALADIARAHSVARKIIDIAPSNAAIVAFAPEGRPHFDGKLVWRVLHGLGFTWGDMDQFQWRDHSHETDDLLWAEVDDGRIGFALPTEIAAGRQNFTQLRFVFDIARNPYAAHVVDQMIAAAETFARVMECPLACYVDGALVEGPDQLRAAVSDVVRQLGEIGVKAGSGSVCRLR